MKLRYFEYNILHIQTCIILYYTYTLYTHSMYGRWTGRYLVSANSHLYIYIYTQTPIYAYITLRLSYWCSNEYSRWLFGLHRNAFKIGRFPHGKWIKKIWNIEYNTENMLPLSSNIIQCDPLLHVVLISGHVHRRSRWWILIFPLSFIPRQPR